MFAGCHSEVPDAAGKEGTCETSSASAGAAVADIACVPMISVVASLKSGCVAQQTFATEEDFEARTKTSTDAAVSGHDSAFSDVPLTGTSHFAAGRQLRPRWKKNMLQGCHSAVTDAAGKESTRETSSAPAGAAVADIARIPMTSVLASLKSDCVAQQTVATE